MKEYLKDNNSRSEISDYLYNKYYVDGLNVSPATKARMQEITSKYNTRVFVGQDTQNIDQVLDKLEDEFRKFEQASNYQCKFPPVVDFNRVRSSYFKRVPGSALSETRTGSLSFSYMDEKALDEALRHELIHSIDKFLKRGKELQPEDFKDVFPQNPKIDPETGAYIIDLNECKYADEFRKAGIEDWLIEYAHTAPQEFVAVAAEGDMRKYSLEFQNVLKKMGMPDWAFNLPAPVKNIDASVNITPAHIGKIGDDKVAASPFRRLKEMFGGSSSVNLSKNYDLSVSKAKNDYPNDGIVRSGQHQRALGTTAPSTVRILDSSVNLKNISQHIENGGVCSVNGKLYVNNNGQAVELKMSQQTFERLFPEKGFAAVKQLKGTNICWLVSSLNSMATTVDGRIKIYSMIEELSDGSIKVQLAGPSKSFYIFPKGKALVAPEIQLGEGAAPGVEMIEQAVLANRIKFPSGTSLDIDSRTNLVFSSGKMRTVSEAYELLGVSPKTCCNCQNSKSVDENIIKLHNFLKGRTWQDDVVTGTWNIHVRHITNYDPNTQMLTFHDPYFDGVDIQMPLDKFAATNPFIYSGACGVSSSSQAKPHVVQQEKYVQSSMPQRAESAIPTRQPQTQDVTPTQQATTVVRPEVHPSSPTVEPSISASAKSKHGFLSLGIEKEIDIVNGKSLKAKYVALSASNVATVEVNGKAYKIAPGTSIKIADGIEIKSNKMGVVSFTNSRSIETTAVPKARVETEPQVVSKPETPVENSHSATRPFEQKTTNLIGQWRTVATTADGTPIDAKVQGDIVIISKNGKETQIPVAKGDVIPVHETSTDTFLIIKCEGFRYTITQSDTPDID